MPKKNPTPSEKCLFRNRLRREAMASRPDFSESLHRRILAAVGDAEHQKSRRPRPLFRDARRRFGVLAALAAAAALAVVLFSERVAERNPLPADASHNAILASSQATDRESANTSPDHLLVDSDTAISLQRLLASTMFNSHSAALKHDLRLTTESLAERLPVDMELLAGP